MRIATIVGVMSWSEGCGDYYFPDVYARVSGVVDWIKETPGNVTLSVIPLLKRGNTPNKQVSPSKTTIPLNLNLGLVPLERAENPAVARSLSESPKAIPTLNKQLQKESEEESGPCFCYK